MRILVGSVNEVKVRAVREILLLYPAYAGTEVLGREVDSGVGEQPHSLHDTVTGAMNRAKAVWEEGALGVGLEGGMMDMPASNTGQVKIDVCVIFDGEKTFVGTSAAYEVPEAVHKFVQGGMEMSEAAKAAGLTTHPRIGSAGGIISILTQDRMTRTDLCKQAFLTAFMHLLSTE